MDYAYSAHMTKGTLSVRDFAWWALLGAAAAAFGALLAFIFGPAVFGPSEAPTVVLFACMIVAGISVGALEGLARRRRSKLPS